ncbi:Uncharacterised protein [Yersinia mollaretii]|nr:Uncharacterised protein [Yersinia mollaretii]
MIENHGEGHRRVAIIPIMHKSVAVFERNNKDALLSCLQIMIGGVFNGNGIKHYISKKHTN